MYPKNIPDIEYCWCRDLPITQTMELTNEPMDVCISEYKRLTAKMEAYFDQYIQTKE